MKQYAIYTVWVPFEATNERQRDRRAAAIADWIKYQPPQDKRWTTNLVDWYGLDVQFDFTEPIADE